MELRLGSIINTLLFYTYLSELHVTAITPEDEGVKYASKCEVCKVLSTELESRLAETGKSNDVLELGYSIDDKNKKKTKYKKSELRLLESLEGLCDRVLEYNIHKERSDSTRFAKGMSETFKTLHGLVDRGVKVDLGMPIDLWDKPSVEITQLKAQCETLLETHEGDIEDWYFRKQGEVSLGHYLCVEKALASDDSSCLQEQVSDKKKKKDEL